MSSNPGTHRRWFGGIVLTIAIGMVVAGESVFRGWLSPVMMLFYWLACFALTALAMVIAVAEAGVIARRITEERRDLVTKTIREIEDRVKETRKKEL